MKQKEMWAENMWVKKKIMYCIKNQNKGLILQL